MLGDPESRKKYDDELESTLQHLTPAASLKEEKMAQKQAFCTINEEKHEVYSDGRLEIECDQCMDLNYWEVDDLKARVGFYQ